jgi:hypothetical protein
MTSAVYAIFSNLDIKYQNKYLIKSILVIYGMLLTFLFKS